MVKILLFGDLHLRKGYLKQGVQLAKAMRLVVESTRPDYVILLGDVLHTHETVYVKALKILEEILEFLTNSVRETFIIVGNHDFVSASENQSSEHPLNPFSRWPRVKIIDRMQIVDLDLPPYPRTQIRMVMTPYLPYSVNFSATLEKLLGNKNRSPPVTLEDIDVVFAHQPFLQVDPKAGSYPEDYPVIYSGHIHDRMTIQDNIHYVGSSAQVAIDEHPDKFCLLLSFDPEKKIKEDWIRLDVRSRVKLSVPIENLEEKRKELLSLSTRHDLVVTITGLGTSEREVPTKTEKQLQRNGITLNYEDDPDRSIEVDIKNPRLQKKKNFDLILKELISKADENTQNAYTLIFGDTKTELIFT